MNQSDMIPHEVEQELASYDPLVQRLLFNRGVVTREDAEDFLNPDFERRHNPFLMPDMERAVVRLFEARESGEKIVVYTDYDCDGIPGAVIMHDFLHVIGCTNFEIYIPHRHDEGYGLHKQAIDEFAKQGVGLLITVDLGITAKEEVAYAGVLGIDVIVTDHHEPPEELPKAFAILNPKVGEYPDRMLCGSGVAFKFIEAFLEKYREYYKVPVGWEKWLLDMVGIATLADMVPLVNENRLFAYYGMMVLKKNKRPGVQALLSSLAIHPQYLGEEDITFSIAPRINAASRMAEPMRAFELLSSKDPVVIGDRVALLTGLNDKRKTLVAGYIKKAKTMLKQRQSEPIIVIGDITWQAGVLGLVAGKLAEEYKKPVFVWGGEEGDILRGSCRSDGSVDLVALMNTLPEDSLAGFGGHTLAGGFSLTKKQAHAFPEKVLAVYESIKVEIEEVSSVSVDARLSLIDISKKTVSLINGLAPFGVGNPKPVFLFDNVTITAVKLFGKQKNHLEIMLSDGKVFKKAIAFFKTDEDYHVAVGQQRSIMGCIEESFFAGRYELRLRVLDII